MLASGTVLHLVLRVSPVSGAKVAVRADSEEAELSSNMTLHWSDDDDDVTVKHLRDDHVIYFYFCPVPADYCCDTCCSRWRPPAQCFLQRRTRILQNRPGPTAGTKTSEYFHLSPPLSSRSVVPNLFSATDRFNVR